MNEIDDEDEEEVEEVRSMLTPKTPNMDDPRLKIPKSKTTPIHDHVIVPKEPVATEE